jgi:predicted dehydrogenase
VAAESKLATQMGNQGRSGEGHRVAAEWIRDGAIGAVREVHAWGSGNWATGRGRPEGAHAVPAGLNWDLWLGPREPRPYHPAYAPFNWRGWWAFGGGGLPDLAPHHLDPAFNALELDWPETVEATTAMGVDAEVVTTGALAIWRCAARGSRGPVSLFWYDGNLRPPTPAGLDPTDPRQRVGEGGHGIYWVGEKGIMTSNGWSGMPRLLPLELHREYKRPEKTLPRVEGGHHADWLRACKGGPQASSDFSYSARLIEFLLTGNVALRARKQLRWDGPNMKATNAPEADVYIKGAPYRAGWELPV